MLPEFKPLYCLSMNSTLLTESKVLTQILH